MGKYSDHATYLNKFNEEVASVSTIVKIYHKDLSYYHWNLGRKGITVKGALDEAASFGTNVHLALEAFLMKRNFLPDFKYKYEKDRVIKSLDNFISWYKNNDLEVEFMERSFTTETYGGTIDCYGRLNGKNTIIDFKTSKGFYDTMFCQLAAYYKMLKEEKYDVEQVAILRVNEKECKIKILTLEELEIYWDIFSTLKDLFYLRYKLNGKKL